MNDPTVPTRVFTPLEPPDTQAGRTEARPARWPGRTYPLASPRANDRRFTVELIRDVAATLCRHGYPSFAGADVLHLRNRLYTIIYQTYQWEDNL